MSDELVELIHSVSQTFAVARLEPLKGHSWPKWFESETQRVLGPFAKERGLRLTAGAGKGTWPEIPWIGLGDERLAPGWQNGLYVTVLFDADLQGFALSLQQGMTEIREAVGMKRTRPILRSRASEIRTRFPIPQDFANDTLDLKASDRRGKLYQVAHVCGRSYRNAELTSAFANDLEEFTRYYTELSKIEAVVALVRSVPTLEQEFPDIAEDSVGLSDIDFARKYAKLIEDFAQDARAVGAPDEGTAKKQTTVLARVGQDGLRKALLDFYEPYCAACNNAIHVPGNKGDLRVSLHAAHVIPVEFGGSTTISNGILLCPNHHWAFDNYCWWIEDDLTISVGQAYMNEPWLAEIHGKALAEPRHEAGALRIEAIRDHRDRAQGKSQKKRVS